MNGNDEFAANISLIILWEKITIQLMEYAIKSYGEK
jgi:hypothetical protein